MARRRATAACRLPPAQERPPPPLGPPPDGLGKAQATIAGVLMASGGVRSALMASGEGQQRIHAQALEQAEPVPPASVTSALQRSLRPAAHHVAKLWRR